MLPITTRMLTGAERASVTRARRISARQSLRSSSASTSALLPPPLLPRYTSRSTRRGESSLLRFSIRGCARRVQLTWRPLALPSGWHNGTSVTRSVWGG